jgi:hypothetical protein
MTLTRFRSLASWGNWTLALSGNWTWFPTHGGLLIGATLAYQRQYGQRWWPIVRTFRLGPFEIIHRLPQGFKASERIQRAVGALYGSNP